MSQKILVDKRGLQAYHKILKEDMLKVSSDLITELTDAKGVFQEIESTRQANENRRTINEGNRVSAEDKRVESEKTRVANEESRVKAEQERVNNYNSITTDEESRKTVERNRVTAEQNRVQNENTRISQENSRVQVEKNRVQEHNNRMKSIDNSLKELGALKTELINNVDEKIEEIDNAKESLSSTVSEKIEEINNTKNSVINDINSKIIEVDLAEQQRQQEHQAREEFLNSFESQLEHIENKNVEQDNRLDSIDAINRRQDILNNALLNENNDKRIILEEDTHNISLDYAKDGVLEINKLTGETLVNVCNQKDPVAITKSYTVENSGNHVALQGEYDGKCRPVIHGNTLVNLVSKLRTSSNITFANGYIENISEGRDTSWTFDSSLFKANSKYTVIYNIMINTLDCPVTLINTLNMGRKVIQQGFVGSEAYTFSTTDTLGEIQGWVDNTTSSGNFKFSLMIFEGDLTQTPHLIPTEYVEGLKSSFENQLITDESDPNFGKYKVEYKVTGKNLFNKSTVTKNTKVSNATGELVANTDTSSSDFIRIKGQTNYYFYYGSSYLAREIAFYDSNKKYISGLVASYVVNFTSPLNAYYVRVTVSTSQLDVVQLEEGTIATSYEPHKSFTKTFYLNSPLLEEDTIEDVNGKATHVHRCSKVVLNGSEDWKGFDIVNGYGRCYITSHTPNKLPSLSISDLAEPVANLYNATAKCAVYLPSSRGLYIGIRDIVSLEDFKQWLQSNNVTVVYQLATPIYETINEESILCDSYTNGHLDFDSVVPVEKVTFKNIGFAMKYLYPSTAYKVQFESDNVGICNLNLGGCSLANQPIVKGNNSFSINTLNSLTTNTLNTSGIGFNASNISVEEKKKEFDYFEGMKSSFEDKANEDGKYEVNVKVVGKNKFDGQLELGTIDFYTGENGINDKSIRCKNYIKIRNTSKYILSGSSANDIGIRFYDENKKYLGRVVGANNKAFLCLPNSVYMRFSILNGLLNDNIQIEEGTVATPYEPYKESTSTILLNSPLLEGDEIKVVDGKLCHVHNYEGKVLDGSGDEGWSLWVSPNTSVYNYIYTGIVYTPNYLSNVSLKLITWNGVSRFNYISTNILNVADFRTWLQANPIKIVYKLATPIIEPLESELPNLVLECFENGTFTVDTALPVTSNISYTGQIPSVKSIVATNEVQDDLINISLCATDEMFMMLEPILEAMPQITVNERMMSKMVDMYVAMVMRGLKAIEEVPARYREEVKKVLAQLEK